MPHTKQNLWKKRSRQALTLLLATVLVVSFTPAASAKKAPLDVGVDVQVGLLCPAHLEAHIQVDGSVLLSFEPGADPNGTRVYRAEGDGEPVVLAELPPGTESFTDTGAQPGTTYVYEVRALVDLHVVLSCPSIVVSVPPEESDPRCPTNLVATVQTNGTVLLAFGAAADVDATVLHRSVGGGAAAPLVELDAHATAFLDLDVLLGTTYTYTLLVLVEGDLLVCLVIDVTVPGDGGDGVCPTILKVVLRVDGSILLLLDAALDVEAAVLMRSSGGGEPVVVSEPENGVTALLDVDALLGLTHAYTLLVTIDGRVLTCPGPVVPVPEDEPCPTNLGATANGDGSILVAFEPHPDATANRVYRAEGDADPELVAELGPDATEFLDEDTVPGTTYTYEVRTVFEGGVEAEGCPTVEVTAIPFFPMAGAGIVASLAGVAAYAGLRRRS